MSIIAVSDEEVDFDLNEKLSLKTLLFKHPKICGSNEDFFHISLKELNDFNG